MKHRVLFLSLACAAALAACQTSATVPSFAANAARSDRAGTTQAWGYVYSDPEGKPLANVRVEIAAWAPVHGKLQPSHQVARTNSAGRFEFTAPNGKYLLTIGSDEAYTPPPGYQTPDPLTSIGDDPGLPNMHWLATVHDTIVLSGGPQQVKASVLPKQAYAAQSRRHTNMCESRQSRIQETIASPNSQVSKRNASPPNRSAGINSTRPPLVPDEWLMENTRVRCTKPR